MEKVYLILRNNIESGPFSLNELLQQQLKPTDMIWVEGKSTAWTYLSEMELNFHPSPARENMAAKPKKRTGKDDIEQKAEEIRKRALSYHPRPVFIQTEPAGGYHTPGGFINPDDTIEIVDHRKERNKNFKEVLMTAVVICVFAGGLYFGSTFIQKPKEIISPAATRVTPPQKTIISQPTSTDPQDKPTLVNIPVADSTISTTTASIVANDQKTVPTKQKTDSNYNKPVSLQPLPLILEEQKTSSDPKINWEEQEKKGDLLKTEIKKEEKKNITEDKPIVNKDTNKTEAKPEEKEKKKGLGKALKNIFGKKNKEDSSKSDNKKQN